MDAIPTAHSAMAASRTVEDLKGKAAPLEAPSSVVRVDNALVNDEAADRLPALLTRFEGGGGSLLIVGRKKEKGDPEAALRRRMLDAATG